jgi:hypothetical protein
MRDPAESAECADGIELLQQCVIDVHGETPRVRELATAALRLEPTDSARLMAGCDLTSRRETRSALAVIRVVLLSKPAAKDAARGWEYLGANYVWLGNIGLAHEAHRIGSSLGTAGMPNCLSRFVCALQLGLRDDAERASKWLDDHVSSDDPVIDLYARALVSQRNAGQWTPTLEGIQLAGSIGTQLGMIGRRIADVVA